MTTQSFLAIHGHFYQPPRENPWIEEVEMESSAAPFHDWNERIYHECYRSNAAARVMDEKGFVVNIVNNLEGINFNFGPALMSWLEAKHPETYEQILEADSLGARKHSGHGGAIAQVYNHMILPLAHLRDKITQVKWGLADFRRRFGREPEAMWLPETACDAASLEVLISHGMKFVILDPSQAEAVRPLQGGNWEDVSKGQIDTRRPYRYFFENDRAKSIDIFFYDGRIARAAGFGDLLFDAKLFMDWIEGAKLSHHKGDQLIHIALDGETFGHHKAYGDRALAYLLHVEAPKRGFRVVNYGEYLESHPPEFEVKLKEGEDGLGTSWSCPHGVKRWKEHCGCRTGGPAEWTQDWRKGLRESLDWLRDELVRVFETYGSQSLKEVWQARDEYIQVILNRSEPNVLEYLKAHAKQTLTKSEIVTCLKLLEMARSAMLMYTSCGWFFTEISGLEAVQILKYAARAVQLAREVTGKSLEEEFLERLSASKSNVPQFKDGRGVYEKLVRPHLATAGRIASFYAMDSLLNEEETEEKRLSHYAYRLHVLHRRKESFGNVTLNFGRVRFVSKTTFEEQDLMFIAVQIGLYDFRCSVKPFPEAAEFGRIEEDFFQWLHSVDVVELLRKIDAYFGTSYYSLKDLLVADRIKIISVLTRESIGKVSAIYEHLYDENRQMNEMYRAIGLPIPSEIRYAAEFALGRQLESAVRELVRRSFNPRKAIPINRILDAARALAVEPRKEEVIRFLSGELAKKTEAIAHGAPAYEAVVACLYLQKLAKKVAVELDLRNPQDHLFALFHSWRARPDSLALLPPKTAKAIFELAKTLQINPKEFKKEFQLK